MGRLKGICISEKRGTEKHEVREAMVKMDWGIEGDAHGGKWHRQISLLSDEKIQEFRAKGAEVAYGAFGENLIVEGFDFRALPVGTRFHIGDVVLEMTQIGKECHSHCQIYKRMGDCIMPREGVFAEVVTGGHIKVGDEVVMEQVKSDRPFSAAVITLSDKGSVGEREDKSGPMIVEMLKDAGYDLQKLVNADIREQPQDYMVEEPDANIDFRRVRNLKVFFAHTAAALTTDVSEIEEWQGGDIVIFERHIGIVSDRRNKNGVPYIIHHNDPWQTAYEQDILEKRTDIVGHYRISK